MALLNVQFQIDDSQLIQGPQGIQGEQGPVGLTGPQGIQGPSGSGSSEFLNIMDYGGTLTGDNTAALNAALADCVVLNKRIITFPNGFFSFQSQPNPINGVRILGQSKTGTYLVRDYSGDFLKFGGGVLGGGGLENCGVLAGAGTSGGYGIYIFADSNEAPDYATFHSLYLSSYGGTFSVPFMVDGTGRANPQGARNIRVTGCDFFAGTSAAVWIANGVGLYMDNVGTYPAGGTNGDIKITSGSTLLSMSNINCQGTLVLEQCSRLKFDGHMIGMTSTSAGSKCFITGTRTGTISNNLGNSYVNLS